MTVNKTPISAPELDWRDDGQPVASAFGDTYFSVENGLEESRYVFLQHNGLPQRWRDHSGAFRIIETGFGTGLNFLMTWQAFQQSAHQDCWLEYTSIEKFPLSKEQLIQAQALWPELAAFTDLLLEQYPDAIPGFHRLVWPEARIALTLALGDVHELLPQLTGPVHAWYLDGFAPSCNPDMWTDSLFAQMRRLNRETVSLDHQADIHCATFTAAGIVRRGLIGAGFSVSKAPGFGRKRDMLEARYRMACGPERPPRFDGKPWMMRPDHHTSAHSCREITVVGAGLAGCSTARALAERGWQVTVLDAAGIANGGSGNPQGGLYVKLAANDHAIHSDFYLQAFQYATRAIQRVLGPGHADNTSWQQCGVLQLAYDDNEHKRQQRFLTLQALPDHLVRFVDAAQASDIAGITLPQGGLFYPDAGWVNPRHLCHQMLQHPNILIRSQSVTELSWSATAQHWHLQLGNGQCLNSQQVVIATAHDARTLLPDAWLPLKSIRGQLSFLDAVQTPSPNTVLCGQSYMAPAAAGQPWLVMGATYNLNDTCPDPRFRDHETNLSHLKEFGPDMPAATLELIKGSRVAFRCTTPDYLPLVGPVPVARDFVTHYKPMVRNAKQIPPVTAPVYPGLWLNVGHGSRGLASTPLCAELLASQITGTALPVSADVNEALWPGRFLLRDMIRRRLPHDWYE